VTFAIKLELSMANFIVDINISSSSAENMFNCYEKQHIKNDFDLNKSR